MGQLIDGVWHDTWYDTSKTGGHFKRTTAQFRHWITPDGAPGVTGEGGFEAHTNRYHLYVSLVCPWAHRTLIMRQLKGLQEHIGVSMVHPLMLDHGWTFGIDFPDTTGDSLYQHEFLYQLYLHDNADYSGRVTVPVLWDKTRHTIVSNEPADIIGMFNSAFDGIGATPGDYYPEALRTQIDALTNGFTLPSITGYTRRDLRPHKVPMMRRSMEYSRHWIGWKSVWHSSAT